MWAKPRVLNRFVALLAVARIQTLAGTLMAFAGVFLDPGVQGAFTQVLPATWVPWFIIAVGIVTEVALKTEVPHDRSDDTNTNR